MPANFDEDGNVITTPDMFDSLGRPKKQVYTWHENTEKPTI